MYIVVDQEIYQMGKNNLIRQGSVEQPCLIKSQHSCILHMQAYTIMGSGGEYIMKNSPVVY